MLPTRSIAAAVLLACASPALPAQKGTAVTTTAEAAYLASPQALVDLGRINDQFIENFIRNDVKRHDALLHPQFLYVGADGRRQNRADYLRDWATGFDPDRIPYWDVRDEKITLVGPVALVRSTNRQVVVRDGREVASMSTYTDTYVYQHGQWRCLQAQISRVAPEWEPADSTIKTVYLRGIRQ